MTGSRGGGRGGSARGLSSRGGFRGNSNSYNTDRRYNSGDQSRTSLTTSSYNRGNSLYNTSSSTSAAQCTTNTPLNNGFTSSQRGNGRGRGGGYVPRTAAPPNTSATPTVNTGWRGNYRGNYYNSAYANNQRQTYRQGAATPAYGTSSAPLSVQSSVGVQGHQPQPCTGATTASAVVDTGAQQHVATAAPLTPVGATFDATNAENFPQLVRCNWL